MKPLALLLAAAGFCLGASVALALIQHWHFGDDPMAMIVGATVGTLIGTLVHSRQPGAQPTRRAKVWLGLVLAASSLAFGLAAQWAGAGFDHPEVTFPISALGSLAFPWAIFGSIWRALKKSSSPSG